MLNGIMLLLTQPVVIGNYMRNIQAASCFSLSVTIKSLTHMHAHTYVCMFLCTYVRMYVCMYVCMYICMYILRCSVHTCHLTERNELLNSFQYFSIVNFFM